MLTAPSMTRFVIQMHNANARPANAGWAIGRAWDARG